MQPFGDSRGRVSGISVIEGPGVMVQAVAVMGAAVQNVGAFLLAVSSQRLPGSPRDSGSLYK